MTVSLVVLVAALLMMAWEAAAPGRTWPKVAGWWLRAAALTLVQCGAVFLAGIAWNGWMLRHRLWSGDVLGQWSGAVAGYLALTFVFYWWHRWRHEVDFLWRWFHQVHHSPQRLEILASFYKHPIEILVNSLLSSLILYLGVGLDARAATGAVLLAGLGELFYHWNARTPYWLGFIFQRPESHCIHHQEGVHNYNYSDLPLWDMLFGTFRNPRRWEGRCGFGDREHQLADMLRGRDVNAADAAGGISTPARVV